MDKYRCKKCGKMIPELIPECLKCGAKKPTIVHFTCEACGVETEMLPSIVAAQQKTFGKTYCHSCCPSKEILAEAQKLNQQYLHWSVAVELGRQYGYDPYKAERESDRELVTRK